VLFDVGNEETIMTANLPIRKMIGVLAKRPEAVARIQGSNAYPSISGCVYFYPIAGSVLVLVSVKGLPADSASGFFGFHIHSGSNCSGTKTDPFADTSAHYNPDGKTHPRHAGDLPPLLSNHGYAFQAFYTDRFSVCEILNKAVIIHSGVDDFTSQPAGNAGEKIACGEIKAFSSHEFAFR